VPALISVFPKLNSLIGMPNPTITKPAARAKVPTLNSNTAILCDPYRPATFAVAFRLNSSGKGKFSLFRKPAATTKWTVLSPVKGT
jgi:hypothetical protein